MLVATAAWAAPGVAGAQVDYHNTDAGRPLRVEDAYTIEHRAFEFQAAPVRMERSRGGVYTWGAEPKLEYGFLPRTQLEIGTPLVYADAAGGGHAITGLAGVDVSLLHNLNVETSIPALAIGADVLLPAGPYGPDRAYPSVVGLFTRTFPSLGAVRLHGNAQYTFGERTEGTVGGAPITSVAGPQAQEVSRWLAGVAMDRTFPLRSTLISAELYAQQPLQRSQDVEYNAGVGVRHQLSPRWNIDAGVGRRLTGDNRAWYGTVGTAVAFGLRPRFLRTR